MSLGELMAALDALDAEVPKGSPPSTYAGYDVVTGREGGLVRFTGLTAMRAALIAPGLYLAGMRGPMKVAKSSLYASVGISAFVLLFTWWDLNREEMPPA